ncbi:uncharacterized protein PHACADRAFT_256813 [Phanerochaete carnosa HHB-10118-sp]|uniref:Cytochrome P450 n=1 Tax=Phanerochaete carnosa (strain HHB-10118-sp) TaxID=650164 RepID=K5V0A2_PHACS|nr:uncharacterized protein PHACADRAFT_256813 [Phanerochaete carnosa HHB-10118-sp]EKM55881.1 hypothetical protein PHACADRAFT_256813 [Phanerochaete carnosa HHB-10118-sp]
MKTLTLLGYFLAGLAVKWAVALWNRPRRRYPPGPKGLPILGNIFNVPLENSWLVFTDWARQYGSDVIHVEALGKHICVVNSAKAAKELFHGRPHIYNDKEQSVMLLELTGWRRAWVMRPYDDYWREHRRLFHQHFRPMAVPQYHPKQTKAVRRLLPLLLDTPGDFYRHIRYMSGSSILDVVYALDVRPGDPRLKLVEKAADTSNHIVNAGVYLVDIIPILKHIPTWFPGAQFKRDAARYKKWVDAMYETPYNQFKDAMREGKAQPCFTAALLSQADADTTNTPELDEIFMSLTGTAYVAGSDTTVIALTTFLLAMVLHPEEQAFVQEELDRVVGRDRLPEMADRESLPRVTAVMQEALRWHSPLPLATPHRAMTDDEYNGYHIPAGSIVMGNSWAILHDEETYPDSYSFNPTRFLSAAGTLRDDVPFPGEVFGYGRRICPGRYFAVDTLFLAIAHILAVFTVERAVDQDGDIIEVKEDFTPQFLSLPKPFKAHFKPRFPGVEGLIRAAALEDS